MHRDGEWGTENTNQSLNTQNTPHSSLTSELWGVFVRILKKNWLRYYGTALYFIVIGGLCFQKLHFIYVQAYTALII